MDYKSLIQWFEEEKRDLPWRNDPSPYAVWVSEVMLQQTQVAVVVPYFERWMQRFPSLKELSEASLDEVIKLWEGLGYYSRARNLVEGAKLVCTNFGGILPDSEEELAKIKGLGPYTIGAIRSFAFHQKTAAVDGNVLRVIARYFQIEDDISKEATKKKIRNIILNFLPAEKHWIVNEALIELGATLCTKMPKCGKCPLKNSCASFRLGVTDRIPYKSFRLSTIPLNRSVGVIHNGSSFLIKREDQGKIMQDLHEFPYIDKDNKEAGFDLSDKFSEMLGISVRWIKSLETVSQSFTKYRVTLEPHLFYTEVKENIAGYHWKSIEEMHGIALSSGHRKILKNLSNQCSF